MDMKEISFHVSRVFNELIFKYGFVHADPHPGNVHVWK